MTGTIDAQEFISHLYKSGLVIVDKKEFIKKSEIELTQLRKDTLGKQTCSITDVIKCKWFKGSVNTIKKWNAKGILRDHEYEYCKVKGEWRIQTSAIIRLLDDEKKKTKKAKR